MESNANNISSAGLHGLDQRQRRSETSEEVDIRQGQNALGSLSLSTGLTPSAIVARFHNNSSDLTVCVSKKLDFCEHDILA